MIELEFAQALETPEQEFEFNFNLPINFDQLAIAPHRFVDDAKVYLKYYCDYDSVLHMKGNISIPCEFVCDRCGGSFQKNLFLDYEETISPSMSEEEELSYNIPKIKLDDIISSFVLLNFPSKILCKEDCKGLCPNCGTNLNDSSCDCAQNNVGKNNPFADLLKSKKLGGKL